MFTETRTGLPGNFLASCLNGDNQGNTGPGTEKRAQDSANGCKRSLPKWNIKREGLYVTT